MSSPHSVTSLTPAAGIDAMRARRFGTGEGGESPQDAPDLLPPLAPRNTCLPLDMHVPAGGYAWWYFDAESDCGQFGLCAIAFVGSVFSPYYEKAHRLKNASADEHIALNVALYGKHKAWVFTETDGSSEPRERFCLRLRKSALRRVDDGYVLDIDERQVPGFTSVRGRMHFSFAASGGLPRPLDKAGEHHWWPVAPLSRVQVALASPQLSWSGRAYHDVNWGSRPLSEAFSKWSWLRALHPEGTLVYYAPTGAPKHPARPPFATLYCFDGSRRELALPKDQALPRGRWGLRPTCPGTDEVVESLEDTPFYTRAKLVLPFEGQHLHAMHEYLDVDRWQRGWVRYLLRFRMRRHKAAKAAATLSP